MRKKNVFMCSVLIHLCNTKKICTDFKADAFSVFSRFLTMVSEYIVIFRDVITGDTLLNCLFPDDDGQTSPNPANFYQLNRLRIDLSDHLSTTGRPYRWAQTLAGLSFSSSKQSVVNGEDPQDGVR